MLPWHASLQMRRFSVSSPPYVHHHGVVPLADDIGTLLHLVIAPMHFPMVLPQDVEVETADGVKLHAWLLYLRKWSPEEIKSKPVILFFQVGGEGREGERGRRGRNGRGGGGEEGERERAEGGDEGIGGAFMRKYVGRGTLGLFAPSNVQFLPSFTATGECWQHVVPAALPQEHDPGAGLPCIRSQVGTREGQREEAGAAMTWRWIALCLQSGGDEGGAEGGGGCSHDLALDCPVFAVRWGRESVGAVGAQPDTTCRAGC